MSWDRTFRAWFAAVVAAAFLPVAASAAVTVYDCKFRTGGARDGNWVPSALVLREDTRTGKIVVFDPIIRDFVGVPIDAAVIDETPARKTFGWEVDARKLRAGRAGAPVMVYRFSHYTNGVPAKVRVSPSGYDNVFTGEGTCQVTTR